MVANSKCKCPSDAYCKIKDDGSFTCHACAKCSGFHEHEKESCGPTHNTKCVCDPGYYRLLSGNICVHHRRCLRGYEVAIPGTPTRDAKCRLCRPDEYSTDDMSFCTKHSNCLSRGLVEFHPGNLTHDTFCVSPTPSPNQNSTSASVATTGSPNVGVFIGASLGPLSCLAFLVFLMCWLKRTGKLDSAMQRITNWFCGEMPVLPSPGNSDTPLPIVTDRSRDGNERDEIPEESDSSGDATQTPSARLPPIPGVGSDDVPVVEMGSESLRVMNDSASAASSPIDVPLMIAVPPGQRRDREEFVEITAQALNSDDPSMSSTQHGGYHPLVVQNRAEPLRLSNDLVPAASAPVPGGKIDHYTAKQKRLADQRVYFRDNLDTSSIVDHLEQHKIINNNEKQRILRQVTDNEKSVQLIDTVLKRGDAAMDVLRKALYEENQSFLADKLAVETQNTETPV